MEIPSPIQHAIGSFDRQKERVAHAIRKRVGYFDQIRVVGYNGFGTADSVFIKGRVLADDKVEAEQDDHELERLRNMFRRYHTDEVPRATVAVTFGGRTVEVETSWEGFFDVTIEPDGAFDDALWHDVELELISPKPRVDQPTFRFKGSVQIPKEPEIGIISDLDDTVLETGATDIFRQARIVLLNGPHSRVPFAGVGEFYRALQNERGRPTNPIFYVSSSPWNIYDLFEEFLEVHDIPRGSILLKEFGFDTDRFIKSGHEAYKKERIQTVLDAYPDLEFVLIGDSGQKDPEIYQAIVEVNPGRIKAIYVRDVTPRESGVRDAEVQKIAHDVQAKGVDMLPVDNTYEAALHARRHGLIDESDLDGVRRASEFGREQPRGVEHGLEKLARSARKLFS